MKIKPPIVVLRAVSVGKQAVVSSDPVTTFNTVATPELSLLLSPVCADFFGCTGPIPVCRHVLVATKATELQYCRIHSGVPGDGAGRRCGRARPETVPGGERAAADGALLCAPPATPRRGQEPSSDTQQMPKNCTEPRGLSANPRDYCLFCFCFNFRRCTPCLRERTPRPQYLMQKRCQKSS